MKNQNQGVIARQTIINHPVKIIVVKSNVVNFTLFKIEQHIAKADIATLNWFLAELKTNTQ